MSDDWSIEPLTASLGAKITGPRLSQPMNRAQAQMISVNLDRHGVLVFPGQDLNLEEHERFATCFGEVQPMMPARYLGQSAVVTLDAAGGAPLVIKPKFDSGPWPQFQAWHSDSTFASHIPRAGVLRAEIIPPVGGDTSWTSLCAAYDGLSSELQQWLKRLNAVHSMPSYYMQVIGADKLPSKRRREFEALFAPREHPVIVRHPATGRFCLFVNPVYTRHIVGLTAKESHAMLSFLFNHIASPEFVYRHRWRAGDIVAWDQLATHHLAPVDYAPHRRRVVTVFVGMREPQPARA